MNLRASDDHRFMCEALALATLGEGTTRPNPIVGCVIVRNGKVVGRGWHRRAGGAHAETIALAEAKAEARGSTVYVNLEPCAHHGRTAPCCDQLLEAGVARVVVSLEDPDTRVSGRGLSILRESGVEVVTGVERERAERLNAIFLLAHRRQRPWVSAKLAVTFDGQIAARGGESRWVSNAGSRLHAHRLRRMHDAIWVGAETLRQDKPRLTVRLPGVEETRPVLSWTRSGALPERAALETIPGRTFRVFLPVEALPQAVSRGWSESELVPIIEPVGPIDPRLILPMLSNEGIRSVLLEGGGATFASFLAAGCVDRVYGYCSPLLIGAVGATAVFPAAAVSRPNTGYRFREQERFDIEGDLLKIGRFELAAGETACLPD